jgi:hypothetical protein
VIRGGNWDNGANAGVFAFNANNGPSNWNNNIGFRCGRGEYSQMARLYGDASRATLPTAGLLLPCEILLYEVIAGEKRSIPATPGSLKAFSDERRSRDALFLRSAGINEIDGAVSLE